MIAAFYDLTCAPPTWDYAKFLVRVLLERQGDEPVTVWVFPGPKAGFRDDRLPPDLPMRQQMLEQVVLRYGSLYPGVETRYVPDRREAEQVWAEQTQQARLVWPGGYTPAAPRSHYQSPQVHQEIAAGRRRPVPLRIHPEWRTWADGVVGGRRCVALVLRECAYWPSRNSDLSAWAAFAAHLRSRGVTPLIVRDTSRASEPFLDFETVPMASYDLRLLAALTQAVEVSFWVLNGPGALVWYGNPAPYRCLKLVTTGAPCVSPDFQAAAMIGPDGRLPWATPDQRFLAQPDTLETLTAAWDEWTWRPMPLRGDHADT